MMWASLVPAAMTYAAALRPALGQTSGLARGVGGGDCRVDPGALLILTIHADEHGAVLGIDPGAVRLGCRDQLASLFPSCALRIEAPILSDPG